MTSWYENESIKAQMTIEAEEARVKREEELKVLLAEEVKRKMEEAERKRKAAEEEAAKNVIIEVEEHFEVTKEFFLIMDERFGARLRVPIMLAQFTSELPAGLTDDERKFILGLAEKHMAEGKVVILSMMKELKDELPRSELDEVDQMKVAK